MSLINEEMKFDDHKRSDRNENDTDETIYSAMLQHIRVPTSNNDSLCTRFIRKKFICIIVFLFVCITALNCFTTITEKLSENHVSELYSIISQNINKMYKRLENTTQIDE
jgi:hypothetical protein